MEKRADKTLGQFLDIQTEQERGTQVDFALEVYGREVTVNIQLCVGQVRVCCPACLPTAQVLQEVQVCGIGDAEAARQERGLVG